MTHVFADHQDGDEYYVFSMNDANVRALFQFRDGEVVNHLNELYQCPYFKVQDYRDASPNQLLRGGALLLYAILVVACGLIWLVVVRICKNRTSAE